MRRYGFHGTSHAYVARQAAEHLGRPLAELDLVTLHLGNGASATAVAGGRSVDTSMGLTPLGGLVMGTRSGDLDPGIVAHLHREGGLDLDEIDTLLNKESGLKGLAGSNDLREVHAAGRRRGRRRRRGAGGVLLPDPLHGRRVRRRAGSAGRRGVHRRDRGERRRRAGPGVRAASRYWGCELDEARNTARSRDVRTISTDDSAVAVLVVPTDEELEIAEQSLAVVRANG